MKKKNLLIILGIFVFTACAELDLNPLSDASSENWYSSEAEIEMSVKSLYNINFWRQDLDYWSDNYMVRYSLDQITGGTINSEFVYGENTWAQAYKAIAIANTILSKLEDIKEGAITQEKISLFKAEARFVRAYEYSILISHFGDVVYYEGNLDIEEAFNLGRTDKSTILQSIFDDFDYASNNLPLDYSDSELFRATKGAAMALKARIALYMEDYTTARDASKACLDLNKYALNPDFGQLFLTKRADESIFLLPRSVEKGVFWGPNSQLEKLSGEDNHPFSVAHYLPRNRGGYAQNDPSWDLFCAFLCTDGLPIDESPLFDPRKPFKNRDPRCSETIVEFGSTHLGIVYQPHPDSTKTYSYITGGLIKNNDSRVNTQYASYNGLLWRKGIDESWIDDLYADPDKVIIRYADVLLMYAEAKTELNQIDATVLNAINQVRSRAYKVDINSSAYPKVTVTNQTQLRKIIRSERHMEFANEGLRYMDLIRWKIAEKVLNRPNYGMLDVSELRLKVVKPGLWFFPAVPEIDDDGVANFDPMYQAGLIKLITTRKFDASRQYLWPIPSKEIKINSNLEQNQGY